MIKVTFTIALLLASLMSQAQNWAPFAVGESHHYRSDTGTWIDRTIHIDSVTNDVNGPIWHFPRLLQVLSPYSAVGNVPHFCQRTMRVQGSGRYQFFNPGNISLDALASLGGMALVDSLGSATGLVTSVYAGSVLGQTDSIKVITLTLGDSLVLSKAHGLVEWPASLGPQRYLLVGLQSQHLGDTLPGFDGIFQFKAGDEYCWAASGSSYDNTRPPSQDTYPWHLIWKVKITSAVRDSSGLHLVVNWFRQQDDYPATTDTSTFFIPIDQNGLPFAGPSEMINVGPSMEPYFFPSQFSNWAPFSVDLHHALIQPIAAVKYIHRNDSTILTLETTDTYHFWYHLPGAPLSDTLDYYYLGDEHFEIIERLGFLRSSSTAIYTTRRETWSIRMTGYVIDGDTVGTVWPDEELVPEEIRTIWTLWPNPANTVVHFEIGNLVGTAQIVDMAGRIVREYYVSNGQVDIPVDDLRPGIYTLGFSHGTSFVARRFVVFH